MTPDEIKAAEARATQHSYPRRVVTGLDQFLNVATGGNLGETISARSQRAASQGHWFGKLMVKALNVFQKGHGPLAEAGDLGRAEKVEELEQKDLGVKDES